MKLGKTEISQIGYLILDALLLLKPITDARAEGMSGGEMFRSAILFLIIAIPLAALVMHSARKRRKKSEWHR